MNREHYHLIFPNQAEAIDRLFDTIEPKMAKSVILGSSTLHLVDPEMVEYLANYAEVSDELLMGEWGGHPRERIALYPPELEL